MHCFLCSELSDMHIHLACHYIRRDTACYFKLLMHSDTKPVGNRVASGLGPASAIKLGAVDRDSCRCRWQLHSILPRNRHVAGLDIHCSRSHQSMTTHAAPRSTELTFTLRMSVNLTPGLEDVGICVHTLTGSQAALSAALQRRDYIGPPRCVKTSFHVQ